MDQAARGAAALEANDFAEAIKQYTAGLRVSPRAPQYYIKRSIAFHRSSPPDFAAALADAETGLVVAQHRGSRELIIEAQLRRAVALFSLGRYADAQFVLSIVRRLNPKERSLGIWESKTQGKMKELEDGDDRAKTTVQEKPDRPLPALADDETPAPSEILDDATKDASTDAPCGTSTTAPAERKSELATSKVKHDWYQSSDKVYVNVLCRGVPRDRTTVEINRKSLTIEFPTAEQSTFRLSLNPLYAPVDAEASAWNITATKLEVAMKKATAGQKWHDLKKTDRSTSPGDESTPLNPMLVSNSISNSKPPAYPTSSKTGVKNWDKVADALTGKEKRSNDDSDDGAGDEKAHLYDDVDENDGDETTRFFRKLYAGASLDQRRAMTKSFSESGGTVLSTDWSNVASDTVKAEPPDGMEEKLF